jgi:hypothetical protein
VSYAVCPSCGHYHRRDKLPYTTSIEEIIVPIQHYNTNIEYPYRVKEKVLMRHYFCPICGRVIFDVRVVQGVNSDDTNDN